MKEFKVSSMYACLTCKKTVVIENTYQDDNGFLRLQINHKCKDCGYPLEYLKELSDEWGCRKCRTVFRLPSSQDEKLFQKQDALCPKCGEGLIFG